MTRWINKTFKYTENTEHYIFTSLNLKLFRKLTLIFFSIYFIKITYSKLGK